MIIESPHHLQRPELHAVNSILEFFLPCTLLLLHHLFRSKGTETDIRDTLSLGEHLLRRLHLTQRRHRLVLIEEVSCP
jgi:hypothetical protein